MFTGLFGGVIGSIVFAITTDLFSLNMRGRVMGFIQTAFAGSQVMGIPLGLYLSNHLGWHAPFLMIVGVSAIAGALIVFYLRPIDSHLAQKHERNAMGHFYDTLSRPRYIFAYAATALLSTGGFMMMPFSSAFSVNNLGISLQKLPMVYMVTGVFSIVTGPFVGRLSDTVGKYRIFCVGSAITIATVLFYTQRGLTPIWGVIAISVVMFIGISSRMISASALLSAVPDPRHRGSFMSVNSSIQQISGGIAAAVAGHIVVQTAQGPLQHFDRLGYVVVGAVLITVGMMAGIHRTVAGKP
jgi:predicted MFS family arabinose efflux permease